MPELQKFPLTLNETWCCFATAGRRARLRARSFCDLFWVEFRAILERKIALFFRFQNRVERGLHFIFVVKRLALCVCHLVTELV